MKKHTSKLRFTFSKQQRLRRKKIIQELFHGKSSFIFSYPFKIYYIPSEQGTQVLVSISKKNIKKAVKRNRLKRQIRELYRLSQHCFASKPCYLAIVYVGKTPEKFAFMQKKWQEATHKFLNENIV